MIGKGGGDSRTHDTSRFGSMAGMSWFGSRVRPMIGTAPHLRLDMRETLNSAFASVLFMERSRWVRLLESGEKGRFFAQK